MLYSPRIRFIGVYEGGESEFRGFKSKKLKLKCTTREWHFLSFGEISVV
jgi:hypothetical protein